MAGKVLLDTNAVIALLANDAALRAVLDGAKIYVPAVVLGEMYYGAFKSAQVEANLDRVERFMSDSMVVDCNSGTAFHYGHFNSKGVRHPRTTFGSEHWGVSTR